MKPPVVVVVMMMMMTVLFDPVVVDAVCVWDCVYVNSTRFYD
jgi:hypothetical protein